MRTIQDLQDFLGVIPDGSWGPKSQAALDAVLHYLPGGHSVISSSFADPADLRAFKACKAEGKSDQDCFKVGDNGEGFWGDNTAQDQVPMVAVPPEDMVEKWGSVDAAKHKQIKVTRNGKTIIAILADTMPHRAHIENGAGLDMNPACGKAFGLTPPFKVQVSWAWA